MTPARKGAIPSGGSLLEPLIHGRVRLLILSYLISRAQSATFTELRVELGLTDGTLSVHLSRLERGGVITVQRRFVGKRPQTVIKITAEGRRRFDRYVTQLRQVIPGLD